MQFRQIKLSKDFTWTRNESSKLGEELGKVLEKVCGGERRERERERERERAYFPKGIMKPHLATAMFHMVLEEASLLATRSDLTATVHLSLTVLCCPDRKY